MAYPTTIDIYRTLVDNIDIVLADHVNDKSDAIINIEESLGTNLTSSAFAGDIRLWAGAIADIPSGWLFCNGGTVNIADYGNLFNAIGTQYGSSTAAVEDTGFRGHTVTIVGGASISNSQYKFDGGSLDLDGAGDYITVADHDDWNFGTGDFTIEMFTRFNDVTSLKTEGLYYQKHNSGSGEVRILTGVDGDGALLTFQINDGSSQLTGILAYPDLVIDTWYHIAGVRYGNLFTLYLNGADVGNATSSGTCPNLDQTVYIGHAPIGSSFNGYLDEVRISKGIARYTAAFTPPTAAFASDGYTVLLLHLNSLSGTFTLPDFRNKYVVGAKQDDSGIAKSNISGSLAKSGGSITSSSGGGNTASNSGGNPDISSHTHQAIPPYTAMSYMIKT